MGEIKITGARGNNTIEEKYLFKGLDEKVLPDVRLTRSRDGSTGTATFRFKEPNILDKSTLEIISDADLTIYNKDNNAIDKLKSDENGMFFYQLPCDDQDLRIVGEKDNFENDTLSFSAVSYTHLRAHET